MNFKNSTPLKNIKPLNTTEQQHIKGGIAFTCEEKRRIVANIKVANSYGSAIDADVVQMVVDAPEIM
jgi:hypothetical protein